MSLHFKVLAFFILMYQFTFAQSIANYTITYEKKVNLSKLFPKWNITDKADKYHKDNYKLVTDSKKSIYERQEKHISEDDNYLSSYMMYSNTFIDLEKNIQISQKEIGEKSFLMTDSLKKLEWHIHDETREIAGYKCRKAMAKYADSIIIVAYFTEDLRASIGPESIGGLPGSILGMVIPKLQTTWQATSVQSMELNPPKYIVSPKSGQKIDKKSLIDILKKVFKEYTNSYSILYRAII